MFIKMKQNEINLIEQLNNYEQMYIKYVINAQNTNNQMKLTVFYQNLMDYLDKLCRSNSNDSYVASLNQLTQVHALIFTSQNNLSESKRALNEYIIKRMSANKRKTNTTFTNLFQQILDYCAQYNKSSKASSSSSTTNQTIYCTHT